MPPFLALELTLCSHSLTLDVSSTFSVPDYIRQGYSDLSKDRDTILTKNSHSTLTALVPGHSP